MAVQLDLFNLKELYDIIPDAVLFVNGDGTIIQVNQPASLLFDYEQDELVGASIETLIPHKFRNKHKQHRELFRQKPSRRLMGRGIDIWARRKDGTIFPADIMLSPFSLEGIDEAVCCVVRDISDQYKAHEELVISENRFKSVWDIAVDAIALSDRDGTVIYANLAYFELYGLTPDEVIGKNFAIIFPAEQREWAREEYTKVFSAPVPPPTYVSEIQRSDGSKRIVESRIKFIKDKSGKRAALVSMIRDITERKNAEEKDRRHAQQLESLLEVGQELTTQLELDSVLNLIVKHAVSLLGGTSGGMYLYRPDQDLLEWVVSYGPNMGPLGTTLLKNEGLSGKVWTTEKIMVVDNYSEWNGRSPKFDSFNWQAMVAVPVMWGKELLGVINILSDKPGAFTLIDKNLLEVFASVAATAIDNARLFTSERDQRLIAETLVEVTLALTVQTDFETILKEILKQTIRLVPCKTANIGLIKNGIIYTDHLIHYDSQHIESLDNEIYPLNQIPILLNLVSNGEPLIIQDTHQHPDWVLLPGSEWIRSFLALPISLHQEVIGVLRIDGDKINQFSEADAELLAPIANAAAIALSRATSMEMAQNEIIERLQAEEALLESLGLIEQAKQDWEATADSFDQIICLLDANGNIIRINRTVQVWELGDFTRLPGKSIHEVLHPNCPNKDCYFTSYWANIWPKILTGGHDDFEVQDTLLGRYLQIQVRPIVSSYRTKTFFSEGSTIKSAVAIINDITEEKRAEEAIFHTQKLESLGVLAGGIAHDFNNLLASILSENSLALLRLPPEDPARTNLERAIQTIERAADLTRQLLTYTGKSQSQKIPLNLNSVIKENLLLLQSTIPRQVNLDTNLEPNLPMIMSDVGQIQQVVMNLIINASEAYEGKPGIVAIKTWVETIVDTVETSSTSSLTPGQYVCFGVADKGIGMDEETLSRIYDPFFTTKFTGRGLGLAAVSGIIRQHKGSIQVTSQVGLGTSFKVMLPATEAGSITQKSELLSSPIKNGCVLVIDDEMSIRVAIADFLGYFGQRVLTANNGKAGLKLFTEQPEEIDIVILDLTMPEMSGRETLLELKKIRPDLPVILLSGFSEEEALEQIGESNQVDFLQKPFRLPALVDKLNAMLT